MTGDVVQELFIPALGMAMEDAILVEWTKQPGDEIAAGDIVAVIETDKTAMEITAEVGGRLGPTLASAGERIVVGTVIGHVIEPGETVQQTTPVSTSPDAPVTSDGAGSDATVSDGAAPRPSADADQTGPEADGDAEGGEPSVGATGRFRTPHRRSPRQRRLDREAAATTAASAEAGVTTATGALTSAPTMPSPPTRWRAKVAAAAAPVSGEVDASFPAEHAPAGGQGRAVPADTTSREARAAERVAKNVTESWQTMPHFAVGREIDVTEALHRLEGLRRTDPQVSLTDLLLQAAVRAWSGLRPDGPDAVAIAVATERRVVNVAVSGAAEAALPDLATRRRRAVDRARRGVLIPGDLAHTELTVSNLGTHGVDWFTGIIPVGQLALLTVGRVRAALLVGAGDTLSVRRVVSVVANLDHRVLDGIDGAILLDLLQEACSADPGSPIPQALRKEGGPR